MRALYVVLYLAAGWLIFLYLLNRYLQQKRKLTPSFPRIVAVWLLITALAVFAGLRADGPLWLVPPLAVLAAAALIQVRYVVNRKRESGAPPVESNGPPASLARPITTTDLALARYEVEAPGWIGPDFRIAHISDLHLDDHLPVDYYRNAIEQAQAAQPDLVFFTGDFVSKDHAVEFITPIVAGVRGRAGTFGILGNHDYWVDEDAVSQAVSAAGVTLLGDDSTLVTFPGGGRLRLWGYQSPWSQHPRGFLPAPQPQDGELTMILSHSPDNILRLSKPGVFAVFSGHFHAGQLQLPGIGSLVVPSVNGRRFDHGHFVINGTHLFVTAGLGAETPPVRVYCRPDIFIIDVKAAKPDGSAGSDHRG
jgi:hypothetical protein